MFLNSALTKEAGTFTAYLARSASAVAAQTVTGATLLYTGYDIVSYINCTMDTHIAPVGWNVTGGNPHWRQRAAERDHRLARVPQPHAGRRVARREPATRRPGAERHRGDGDQLGIAGRLGAASAADVAAFFPDRATILHGATDGRLRTTGLATFSPVP